MSRAQAVCNYALLQYLPHPETGEFVNVGVVVQCCAPSLFDFALEDVMPARAKTMFPWQQEAGYGHAMGALRREFARIREVVAKESSRGPRLFAELTRRRESTFRFGEMRTILAADASTVATDLFRRYVRMEMAASLPSA